jgi:hypothetical protein
MSNCDTDWSVLQKVIDQLSPAERLHLIEAVAKSLQQPVAADPKQRKVNLDRLRRNLASLPTQNPADGFSGRDHDRVLYGGPR